MLVHPNIKRVLDSPNAAQQIQTLNLLWGEEQKRRREFWDWVTEDHKAEFINGEVVLHSPVKRRHWRVSSLLATLLNVYVIKHQLGEVASEKAMISLTRNDYEPDICFFDSAKAAKFTPDQMLLPAPDFVVEILSRKAERIDRGIKKQDYAAHGIKEYWIIDAQKARIEQYLLTSDLDTTYFAPYIYTLDDTIESRTIGGFSVAVRAIFEEEAHQAAMQVLLQNS